MTETLLSRPASKSAAAWRIRFVTDAPAADVRVLGQFTDPVVAWATAESIEVSQLRRGSESEAADELQLLLAPAGASSGMADDKWLAPSDQPGSPRAITIPLEKGTLSWRPGRAVIEGPGSDQVIQSLIEFAFYEGELRKIEEAIRPHEATAQADAAKAFRVRLEDRERFGRIIEALAGLRLKLSRLEPHLYVPDRTLPIPARRIIARLWGRAAVEDRLEAVSNRLEACEDLYEGALDRITDHRWYRRGNQMEFAIIVLLLIEVVQLFGDMILRFVFHVK